MAGTIVKGTSLVGAEAHLSWAWAGMIMVFSVSSLWEKRQGSSNIVIPSRMAAKVVSILSKLEVMASLSFLGMGCFLVAIVRWVSRVGGSVLFRLKLVELTLGEHSLLLCSK